MAASSALRNISGLILAALVLCAPTALLAAPEAECPRTIDPLEADVFLESWLSDLQSGLDAGASMHAMDPFQLLFLQRHHTALDKKLRQGFDPDACGGPLDMSLLGTAATPGAHARCSYHPVPWRRAGTAQKCIWRIGTHARHSLQSL